MVSEGCVVDGYVDFSVLFQSVVVEEGATVRDSIVLPGSVIKKGANIQYAIIGENCVVEEGATVGQRPENVENMGFGVASSSLIDFIDWANDYFNLNVKYTTV